MPPRSRFQYNYGDNEGNVVSLWIEAVSEEDAMKKLEQLFLGVFKLTGLVQTYDVHEKEWV